MTELDDLVRTIEPPESDSVVKDWLTGFLQMDRQFLLAYADDGIIWGKFLPDGRTCLASDLAPDIAPALAGITLQQAFVFGPKDEIRLFQNESGCWQARQIADAQVKNKLYESQILWGDRVASSLNHGFTRVRDTRQRVADQILPIPITQDELDAGKFPRLNIHHFVEIDPETGEARIGLSRLVSVELLSDEETEARR